jgi:hypothetical protein
MQHRRDGGSESHTACQDFNYRRCYNPSCPYSHTIIDVTRFIRLVKALHTRTSPKVRLLLKYSIPPASTSISTTQGGEWRLHLNGGHLGYYVKGLNAVEVFKAAEDRCCGPFSSVCFSFTRSLSQTDFKLTIQATDSGSSSHTICMDYLENRCPEGSRCRNRHDLFDTARIEALSRRLLQSSPSAGTADSDISLAYTHDGHTGQWEIDFKLWQGSSYIKQAIVDADLRAAMSVAERSVLSTRESPTAESTDHNSRHESAVRRSDESPPSYAAATASHLPSYHAIIDATSRRIPRQPDHPASVTGSMLPACLFSENQAFTSFSVSSPHYPNPTPSSTYPHIIRPTIIYPNHVHDSVASERRPLLPQRSEIQITYNAINNPALVQVGDRPRSSPADRWDRGSEVGQGTPLVVQFMGMVLLAAICWIIIVVITLPCSEATC